MKPLFRVFFLTQLDSNWNCHLVQRFMCGEKLLRPGRTGESATAAVFHAVATRLLCFVAAALCVKHSTNVFPIFWLKNSRSKLQWIFSSFCTLLQTISGTVTARQRLTLWAGCTILVEKIVHWIIGCIFTGPVDLISFLFALFFAFSSNSSLPTNFVGMGTYLWYFSFFHEYQNVLFPPTCPKYIPSSSMPLTTMLLLDNSIF